MKYTRLYTGPDGETHFEDLVMAFEGRGGGGELSGSIPVKAVQYHRSRGSMPAQDWHTAPRRQFILQISASTEREVSDGEVRRFGPGTLILVEDLTGKGHITRGIDDGGERLMLFMHLAD